MSTLKLNTPSGGSIAVVPTDTASNVTLTLPATTTSLVDSSTLAASGGSALVGFLQSGTGAVAGTVQSKLREWVSVDDFIPVGTNTETTNCSAYIQAALNYSGFITLGEKQYLCTSGLILPGFFGIRGKGIRKSSLRFTLSGGTAIYGDTVSTDGNLYSTSGTMSDFAIYNSDTSLAVNGIYLKWPTRTSITNVEVSKFTLGDNIRLESGVRTPAVSSYDNILTNVTSIQGKNCLHLLGDSSNQPNATTIIGGNFTGGAGTPVTDSAIRINTVDGVYMYGVGVQGKCADGAINVTGDGKVIYFGRLEIVSGQQFKLTNAPNVYWLCNGFTNIDASGSTLLNSMMARKKYQISGTVTSTPLYNAGGYTLDSDIVVEVGLLTADTSILLPSVSKCAIGTTITINRMPSSGDDAAYTVVVMTDSASTFDVIASHGQQSVALSIPPYSSITLSKTGDYRWIVQDGAESGMAFLTAAPTKGNFMRGFVYKKNNPTSGTPTGWVCSYTLNTKITLGAAGGAVTFDVASASGLAVNDRVGILLSNGTWHWTYVTVVASNTVTINAALPSAASANALFVATRWLPEANLP